MKYVILRDDDTNALTPVSCLERLYRPFLDRGLPVNLATIPCVNTSATLPDGRLEGFLMARRDGLPSHLPLASNRELLEYLAANRGYNLLHHGFAHDYLEFDSPQRPSLAQRLEEGAVCFERAGLPRPGTFVAPYDQISRAAYEELARRFRVISTGWFELRRLPVRWWGRYAARKALHRRHWSTGSVRLLSHPGCLLSYRKPTDGMLDRIKEHIQGGALTVLVTHWWEYFANGQVNEPFIAVLHQLAEYLATAPDIRVISFAELESAPAAMNRILFGNS
jgi:hypothetical protein